MSNKTQPSTTSSFPGQIPCELRDVKQLQILSSCEFEASEDALCIVDGVLLQELGITAQQAWKVILPDTLENLGVVLSKELTLSNVPA